MENTTSNAAADLHSLAYIAPDLHPLIVAIDSVRPMPGNARVHGERDLSALAASLGEYGQRTPIVAKAEYRGTERAILKGCGTWMAAKRLGWLFIAVTWFTGNDSAAAAYSVLDNRLAELSAWNPEALDALQADGVDLLSLGWSDAELLDLLGSDDAPIPRFEPEAPAHRLDELRPDATCPRCGLQFRQEPR